MIEFSNGKYRTIRPPAESSKVIQDDLASLTPAEREALKHMLKEMSGQGDARILKHLDSFDYKGELVDMRTFVKDEHFLGKTCDVLYDKWLEDLDAIFENRYREIVFTGSIGSGKSFAASVGICRMLYELSMLKNPHRTFGIAPGSNISIVVFSVNAELAMKVAFENIVSKLQASPYFQENFPFEVTKKELRFPNSIWVAPRATTDTSALGLNVVSAFLDEANFLPQKKVKNKIDTGGDKAEQIYNGLKRRMKSRFQKKGKLPGVLFIVSSKNTKENFTERLIAASKKDPTFWVSDYSTWDVKPSDLYSGEKFHVLVGNEQTPSRILTPAEGVEYSKPGSIPDGCVLIEAPEEFRPDFEKDLEGAVRDMAGIATVSISPFIQRREKLLSAVELGRKAYGPSYRHPFTVTEFEPGKPGKFMWDRMVQPQNEKTMFGGIERRMRPILNPKAIRHIHIDPSLSGDATGFCMAHISGWKDVIRKAGDGTEYSERAPLYTVDLILRVVPPVGDEIILGDMRQFIYDLSAHGYLITTTSLDSWQSADTLQQLESKGYQAERVSVDTSLDPYDNLKMALYEDRLIMYEYEPLLEELRQIQKDLIKRKVDHPPDGSKDCADALAGCLYTLSMNRHSQPMPIVRVSASEDSAWMPEMSTGSSSGVQSQDVLMPFIIGGGKFGDD